MRDSRIDEGIGFKKCFVKEIRLSAFATSSDNLFRTRTRRMRQQRARTWQIRCKFSGWWLISVALKDGKISEATCGVECPSMKLRAVYIIHIVYHQRDRSPHKVEMHLEWPQSTKELMRKHINIVRMIGSHVCLIYTWAVLKNNCVLYFTPITQATLS